MSSDTSRGVGARAWVPYVVIAAYLLLGLFPFFVMAITAVKPNAELYSGTTSPLMVHQLTMEHYRFLFEQTDFLRWFWNSTLVAALATSVSVVISAMAAYALARVRFRGSTPIGIAIFLSYLVPPTLLFVPLVDVVSRLRLADSIWSLVLTYPTFLVPFSTWMLTGYFKTIPRELEECAMVDGASRFRVLLQIILPLAVPGLVTATLFSFTLCWGEMIYAVSFISATPLKTLPIGVATSLVRGDVYFWGPLMAGALLASVPIVFVYSFLTEYFVSGLTAGATKG